MKAIRIVGSVFSSILMPFIVIILCAALLLFNAATLITETAITQMLERTMNNEQVVDAVTDTIAENLFGEDSSIPLEKETLETIIQSPSVQNLITDLVTDSATEITSGEFSGTLDVGEKLTDILTEEPERLDDISADIAHAVLSDPKICRTFADSVLGEDSTLDEATVERILQSNAVKQLFADVIKIETAAGLGVPTDTTVDVCDSFAALIEEEPVLADSVIESYFPDSNSFYAAVAEVSAHAAEIGAKEPPVGISKKDFVLYCLDLYREECNDYFLSAFASVDYTDYEIDMTTPEEDAESTLVLQLSEEDTKTLNMLCSALSFLRSITFLFYTAAAFIVFYLMFALLTLSFTYAMTFSGISALLTGAVMIGCTFIPVSDLVATQAVDTADSMGALILSLIETVWSILSTNLIVTGIVCVVIGIVFIATPIAIRSADRKKAIPASV